MPTMRMAIGMRYKWYYHATPVANADGIRDGGLLCRADAPAPQEALDAIGPNARHIVCLNPLGADMVPAIVQQGPYICLAIHNGALPYRLGLDWSYDGAVSIAEVLRKEQPNLPAADIFVGAVKRWGSLIGYDPIPREHIRVCVQGRLPHDPTNWPFLNNTTNDILIHF